MAEEPGRGRRALSAVWRAVRPLLPDLSDVFIIAGLSCAAYGVAQFSAPAAWILVGVVLFWLGVRR